MRLSPLRFVAKCFGRDLPIRATDSEIPEHDNAQYFLPPDERIHLRPHLRGKHFMNLLGHEFHHAADQHADEGFVQQFWDDFAEILYRDDVLARCRLRRIDGDRETQL